MNYFKKWNLLVGWIVFAIAAIVYILTMEPTTSLWDCAEFIATSYKLEVGHPPGAPLFMMVARLFTAIGGSPENAAMMVNLMSSLASAFTILFLFWSITHLARKMYAPKVELLSKSQIWSSIGAGAVGALAYAFSDTFWFSAIEAEVYAMSSLFTAMAFWAILQWENIAEKPHSTRWLILIAYLMGLSIGVHILNLLTIPALVFVYYFKKYPKVTKFGIFMAFVVSGAILLAINALIIPYTVAMGAWLDRIFVNNFDLPINSGLTLFAILVFVAAAWGIYYTHIKGKVTANTIILCTTVILIGYSSYASVIIRANANPPMNSNNPSDPYALLRLLNRDQYGRTPLLTGPYYSSPAVSQSIKTNYMLGVDGKYHKTIELDKNEYLPQFTTFFPRMWSDNARHIRGYKSWVDIKGKQVPFRDELITIPTFGENLTFFFRYQLNFMYWRYFLWNFVGRQSDIQNSYGSITDGNWLSGIDFIDQLYLGPQDNLPSEMSENTGRNTYFFLPFILGLLGLLYQLKRDKKNFSVVMLLFLMMGIVLVLYFNNKPYEPRERDYIFAGSFYAFCIWIGLGVVWLKDNLTKYLKKDSVVISVVAIAIASSVPLILAVQNWDDHDRSGRYFTRDIGANYLNSTLPNSIIINYGDNDTFPLWYSQEVEGTRPDVRIMNGSYLGMDWYVDQMRIKSNESMALPFSLSKSKVYQYGQMHVKDKFKGKTITIGAAMYLINSEHPKTKHSFYGGEPEDFLASKNLALPVNKKNAIASGIVSAKDAHLMVDTVYMKIKSNVIDKSELMLLDLLANFDWKRPIYFTQLNDIQDFGLMDYLQFDGLAYRLVPIKTPSKRGEVGRINTEYLYSNLMNKFKYGNVSDPDVNIDHFVDLNINASDIRYTFPRLAHSLVAEGDTVRAIEVLDRGLEEMPITKLRHDPKTTISMIEAYYAAKAFDKGNILMDDYTRVLEEYIEYYITFPNSKANLISNEFNYNLQLISELYTIAGENGQNEQAARIYNLITKYEL